jgi:hypothetical protein
VVVATALPASVGHGLKDKQQQSRLAGGKGPIQGADGLES